MAGMLARSLTAVNALTTCGLRVSWLRQSWPMTRRTSRKPQTTPSNGRSGQPIDFQRIAATPDSGRHGFLSCRPVQENGLVCIDVPGGGEITGRVDVARANCLDFDGYSGRSSFQNQIDVRPSLRAPEEELGIGMNEHPMSDPARRDSAERWYATCPANCLVGKCWPSGLVHGRAWSAIFATGSVARLARTQQQNGRKLLGQRVQALDSETFIHGILRELPSLENLHIASRPPPASTAQHDSSSRKIGN